MEQGNLFENSKQYNVFESLKQDNLKVLKSRRWRQSVGRFHKQYEKFLTRLYDYVRNDKVIFGCGDMAIITAKDFAEENGYTVNEVKSLLVELALAGAIKRVHLSDLSNKSKKVLSLVKTIYKPLVYNKTYLLINDFNKADWHRISHWHYGSKPNYATVKALYGKKLADNVFVGIRNMNKYRVVEKYGRDFHDIVEQNKVCAVTTMIKAFNSDVDCSRKLMKEAIDGWVIEYGYYYAKDNSNMKYIVKNKNTIYRSDNLQTVKKEIF